MTGPKPINVTASSDPGNGGGGPKRVVITPAPVSPPPPAQSDPGGPRRLNVTASPLPPPPPASPDRVPGAMRVTPSPVPSAPTNNTTRAPRAIGEDARLPVVLEKATQLAPATANEPMFRGLLNKFLKQKPREWLDWGNDALSNVSDAANKQGTIANMMKQANVSHWLDQTNQAIAAPSKPVQTGLMGTLSNLVDRSPKFEKPAHYELQLTNGKRIVTDALQLCMEAEEKLREKVHYITMHCIVVQAVATIITDHDEMVICDNKVRTLLSAQQTAEMQLQAFENLEDVLNKQIANVDQMLFVMIPQWKLALSQA